jgi:uncharacterized protein YggE
MRLFSLTTACTAALAAAIAPLAVAQNPNIQINKDNRTISISTDATASAPAEVATVHIGFAVYAPDEQSAYAQGSQRSNAIAKALADAGVSQQDIQSDSQSVAAVQPYDNNLLPDKEKALRQFKVSQSWSVKTTADSAAKILHVAVLAGANESGNIDWNVKDPDALQAQAAANALTRAKSIASSMAAGLGVKLGPLVYASNQTAPAPQPMFMRRDSNMMNATVEVSAEPLAISPQKVEKSATVYAVFTIE